MNKPLLIGIAAFAALSTGTDAFASGSSTVMFTTKHFQLRLETPRMIFKRSADEARWHLAARVRLKRDGAALRERLLAVIARLARSSRWLHLGRFARDLPRVTEVGGKLVATKRTPLGLINVPTKGKGPYNIEVPLPSAAAAMVTLTLTVERIPAAKRRAWLTKRLGAAARPPAKP